MQKMIEVPATEANNYSRILTLLGMEEEGDPVAEIERMKIEIERLHKERNGLAKGDLFAHY